MQGQSQIIILAESGSISCDRQQPEAFSDLWVTLKEGLPWTGMVKNRCKNGDYYWVLANVTPVIENNQTVGYMSVRTRPRREQIEAAETVYRRLRENNAQGLAISRGAVVSTGVAGRLARLLHMPLQRRIGMAMSTLMACLLGITAMAWATIAGSGNGAGGASLAIGATAVAGIGIAAWLWAMLHHSLVKPLSQATQAARIMAGGDLSNTVECSTGDGMGELLRALEQMRVNLRAVIGDVRANAQSIMTGTREIAAGNMDLSARTESQASSLEETASSMEQFAATVKQNADNAVTANQLAASASEVAGKGGAAVTEVGNRMPTSRASMANSGMNA